LIGCVAIIAGVMLEFEKWPSKMCYRANSNEQFKIRQLMKNIFFKKRMAVGLILQSLVLRFTVLG